MLSISILSLACGSTLFSGDTFEDQVASLTWPCTLPPLVGHWSVIRLRSTMTVPSDVMYGLHHDIMDRRLELVLFFAAANSELLLISSLVCNI